MLKPTLQRLAAAATLCSAGFAAESHARTIEFSGYTWDVKAGAGRGPGPNDWSDAHDSVWVDAAGDLHLTVRNIAGNWFTTEVINQTPMGYGTYTFRTQTDPDGFDPNVVVGLFLYENDDQEIDIEFTRWGDPNKVDAQYAVQPAYVAGNKHRFATDLDGNYSTHIIEWAADQIVFTSIHGHHDSSPPGSLMQTWTYTGDDIPDPTGERVHMNLWLFGGNAPTNGQDHEFVIDSFSYAPPLPEPGALAAFLAAAPLTLRRPRRA